MKKNLANILTSIRLIGALVLIFFDIRTPFFLVLYAVCGLTDVLDGLAARRFHAESEFGKKLDSAADVALYGMMLVKAQPLLSAALPRAGLLTISGLIFIRFCLYVIYWLMTRRFLSTHSIYNKAVSILLFFLPFALQTPYAAAYCYLVMAVAAVSLFDEALHFRKNASNAL